MNVLRHIMYQIIFGGVGTFTRYFRRNGGLTAFVPIPVITLNSDLEITLSAWSDRPAVSFPYTMLGNSTSGTHYLVVYDDLRVQLQAAGGALVTPLGVWSITKENKIVITRVGTLVTLNVNGTTVTGTTELPLIFDQIYKYLTGSGFNFVGVISDIRVTDNGTLIRSYAMNDNSDVIVDSVNGQNGVVTNGSADDWGVFADKSTLWKGQGLTVPPWVSIDQELLKE